MGKKTIVGLIAIIAIALVVAFSGCIEKTPESITPETPSEIPAKSEGTLIDAMKLVPKEGNLLYIDCKKLCEDPDLAPIWDQLDPMMNSLIFDFPIPESDIPLNKLYYWSSGDYFYVIGGDFDLGKIRDDLQHRGWERSTYRGVEVWQGEGKNDINEIALFKDKIIAGSVGAVEMAIRVMKGEEESLYDDEDVMDIANKLSDGFITIIKGTDTGLNPARYLLYLGYGGHQLPDDVKGWGSSHEKISKEEIKMQGIIKFTDESKAKDFVSSDWTAIEVTVQEEYVMYTPIYKIDKIKMGLGIVDAF